MSALVSVVVPCYNIEKYVEKCIDSILNQTYENLEIILVDDGATDNTGKILDKIKDKRVKVIHQKNAGLSAARNSGLKIATGKYVCFIDGDDFIDEKYVETLLNFAEKSDSDITICGYYEFYEESGEKSAPFTHKPVTYTGEQAVRDYFHFPSACAVVAWNKLYKTELFKSNKIEYPVGKKYEDSYTTYKLFYKSEKITYISSPLYFYLQRRDSIMGGGKFTKERFANTFCIIDETKEYFKDNGEYEKYIDDITIFETICLSYGVERMIKEGTHCDERVEAVKRLRENRKKIYKMPYVSKIAKMSLPFLNLFSGKGDKKK